MPNVWVVTAVFVRRNDARRQDMSAPTTYTLAKKEIERLGRLGIRATMKEVAVPVIEARPKAAPAAAANDKQTAFAFVAGPPFPRRTGS